MSATSSAADGRRHRQLLTDAIATVDSPRVAWSLMALASVVAFGVLYHMTRGTSFWADEWLWITGRRSNTVGTFLHPFNGHLSLVPIAIYRVMFAIFGIDHYGPYRVLAIAGHVACALLVFAYVRSRLRGILALASGLLVLFLGPGWQDMLWGFQIAWTVAVAAGIAAFLLLDRRDRRSDVAACILIGVSLASTSVGVPIAIGLAVDLALIRRRPADAWIVAIPLALYVIWTAKYHAGGVTASEILNVPSYVGRSAATALSGLAGLSGLTAVNETGTTLEFGFPLAVAVAAAIAWLLYKRSIPARAASLLVVLLVYWALIAVERVLFAQPGASRYVYVSCIFALLLVVELARGSALSPATLAAVVVVAAAALLSNIGILRDGANFLRSQGAGTDADLAALNLVRGTLPAGYIPTSLPLSIFNPFTAQSYFAARRALGTPAYSTTQLASASASARATADHELIHAGEIASAASHSNLHVGGGAAHVEAVMSATVAVQGSCLTFDPTPVTVPGAPHALIIAVPPTGVRVNSHQAPAMASARRFGAVFNPLGSVQPGAAADVTARRDGAAVPWRLELQAAGATMVCTLTPG